MPSSLLPRLPRRLLPLFLALLLSGCAALSQVAALTQVRFSLDRVSQVSLAGVALDGIRGYEDLSARDILQVTLALTTGELPLEMALEVGAENPEGNPDARLLAMDWSLFLQKRETISGALEQPFALPSGARIPVRIPVRLDLLEFFEGSARDLVELAAALAGVEGEPVTVGLRATPTVDTPLGPIRYPRPLELGHTVR